MSREGDERGAFGSDGPRARGAAGAPSTDVAARGVSPRTLAYGVGPVALALLLALRHFGLVARVSGWAYVGTIFGSLISSRLVECWRDAPLGSWKLHTRVAAHVAAVASVVYVSGWGPALGMAFAFSAFAELEQSGSVAWRAAAGWSVAGCALGQLLVLEGWMPSFLGRSQAQTIGLLGAFVLVIAIRMAGAIIEHQEHTEALLAERTVDALRSEAHHRAVIENAAEGILTIELDGTVGSFNAAAEAMFGWTASEIAGRPAALLVPSDRREQFRDFLEHYMAVGPRRTEVESLGIRRDGTQFPLMVSTNPIALDGKVTTISAIARDLSEQKRVEAQLAHQALHDRLTGLPNRMMLTDRLEQACARLRRHGHMFGVMFVDLDRFKSVNDSLGHSVGDQLLVEAGARIQRSVRETDTVARLGGDEFVVVCEDIDGVHNATELAQRILDNLRLPFRFGDDDVHTSASVGMALTVDGTTTADVILANADIAMYRAKQNGRGRYELFDEAMQEWVTGQLALEAALRQAVPRRELRVFYQPIISADTALVRGFEALVRWERPGYGLVAPDAFIPTAEETGLILEIGAWVLEEACSQAASWSRRWPDRPLGISVNVSARQLLSGDFLDVVRSTLTSTGLDPIRLTLELTESTLVDDEGAARTLLRDLRALGINLSLDDFGTGYSSLTYLRSFPINVVKIDRSFVRTIGTERQDTAIVAAVLALARNLELNVVAEGVENDQQLAVLLQLQCPYLQGYLFSRPRPLEDIPDMVEMPSFTLAQPGTLTLRPCQMPVPVRPR